MNILSAIKREEKRLEKQMSKVAAPTERNSILRKSSGTFSRRRSERRETRVVCCGQSRDLESGEEAVGEREEAGKESPKLIGSLDRL